MPDCLIAQSTPNMDHTIFEICSSTPGTRMEAVHLDWESNRLLSMFSSKRLAKEEYLYWVKQTQSCMPFDDRIVHKHITVMEVFVQSCDPKSLEKQQ